MCNEIFSPRFEIISGDGLCPYIKYLPSWKKAEDVDAVLSLLKEQYERDRKYEMTTSGPHRDRFSLYQDGRNFIHTASTGQIRLSSLLLKSTQAVLFEKITGRKPILLLDDVLLELDTQKRERFLDHLSSYDQAFFTFLPNESYFKKGSYDRISYLVEKGTYTLR